MSLEERLSDLLDRYEQLREHGQTITPEELCRTRACPELLEPLKQWMHKLAGIDVLFNPPSEPSPAGLVELGERYLQQELHAEGGLGKVYRAQDKELHRTVALKRIRGLQAHYAEVQERFEREAHITGQLEHPGIVPVYGFGRDKEGKPYYAMRLIEGQTLEGAIRQFHGAEGVARAPGERTLALQKLLRHFLVVCQTIAYAHSRGVIHRDIKPKNIMVGKYGEILVVDWGLAKAPGSTTNEAGAPASGATVMVGDVAATVTGCAQGTPAYMSPEQAEGHWDIVGPPTDIYSLGATLYALLAGRPPYGGKSSPEVIQLVKDGTCQPARKVNPAVPPALEAICEKAMQRRPDDRYVDALALAEDVEHWLADEPVSAWREPWTVKARRWVKRHRLLSTTAGVSVVVALLVGGVAWSYVELAEAKQREKVLELESKNREEERDKQGRKNAAESRAEDRVKQAELLREQSAKAPPGVARSLLTQAHANAKEAAGSLGDSYGDEKLRARTRRLVKQLENEELDRMMLARLDDALFRPLYQSAMVHSAMLVQWRQDGTREPNPFQPALRDQANRNRATSGVDCAAAFGEYGIDVRKLSKEAAAKRIQASAIRAKLAAALDFWAFENQDADESRRLHELARLADDDVQRNRVRDALLKKDLQSLRLLATSDNVGSLPATTLLLLGRALNSQKASAEAEFVLRGAQTHFPDHYWVNSALAATLRESGQLDDAICFATAGVALRPDHVGAHLSLGVARAEKKQFGAAIESHRRALDLQSKNLVQDPLVRRNLGNLLAIRGLLDEAVEHYQVAAKLQPKDPLVHRILGSLLAKQGSLDKALEQYEEAVTIAPNSQDAHFDLGVVFMKVEKFDKAREHFLKVIDLQPNAADAHSNVGHCLAQTGQLDEAIEYLHKAVKLEPRNGIAHANLGAAYLIRGKIDKVIEHSTRAINLLPDNAPAHSDLGDALRLQKKYDEAFKHLRKALEFQPNYAPAHTNLANTLRETGQLDEAIDHYRTSIKLRPKNAVAHRNLGWALIEKKQFSDEAIEHFREALKLQSTDSNVHVGLGWVLKERGRFTEAFDAYKSAHDLLAANHPNRRAIAAAMNQAQELIELDRKLVTVRSGKNKPADDNERMALAWLSQQPYKRFYVSSARFWREVFAGDPKPGQRFSAACAAALAAAGQGPEAAKLDVKERSQWRKQALDWLQADLNLYAKHAQEGQVSMRMQMIRNLRQWQESADLASVREIKLATLPQDQQKDWQKLWSDVAQLLKE